MDNRKQRAFELAHQFLAEGKITQAQFDQVRESLGGWDVPNEDATSNAGYSRPRISFANLAEGIKFGGDLVSRIDKNTDEYNGSFFFTGENPYFLEDLMSLVPHITCHVEAFPEWEDTDPHFFILGQENFNVGEIREYVENAGIGAKFLPQEGFLDLVLFGCNWWEDEISKLNNALTFHPGLQFVKSLESPKFQWPSIYAQYTAAGTVTQDMFNDASFLKHLGYTIWNDAATKRRTQTERRTLLRLIVESNEYVSTILENPGGDLVSMVRQNPNWFDNQKKHLSAVPSNPFDSQILGGVANTIASHITTRKSQQDGENRYVEAITRWTKDLAWLKETYYDNFHYSFVWPS